MKLPQHTIVPHKIRGFSYLVWERPKMRLANGDKNPDFLSGLGGISEAETRLAPWRLFEPMAMFPAVCDKRTLWTRLTTWWLNRQRKAERQAAFEEKTEALKKYFAEEAVHKRIAANESTDG